MDFREVLGLGPGEGGGGARLLIISVRGNEVPYFS